MPRTDPESDAGTLGRAARGAAAQPATQKRQNPVVIGERDELLRPPRRSRGLCGPLATCPVAAGRVDEAFVNARGPQ